MSLILLTSSLAALLVFPSHFSCAGFSSTCIISRGTPVSSSKTSLAIPSSASVSPGTNQKISYRSAKQSDVAAIAGLLKSVFEDDEKGEGEGEKDHITTNNHNGDTDDNNTFMWESLTEESNESKLSSEQQLEMIKEQLAKRMTNAKREDYFLPHSFLVATIPSEQQEDRVIGFLEMGTLPPPILNSCFSNVELPYIGNVAVSNDVRRRKVGSTLVRLATKIATKWCVPSSLTSSSRPFLFLSVERYNENALNFYERLGFDELKVAKKSIEKIYLAQGLN